MFQLVSKLIIQKLFKFEKGHIELYGIPLTLLPIQSIVKEQMLLEEKNLENIIYFSNKHTGLIWNENMVKKFKTKTHKQIVDEGNKVMSLAGWGEFKEIMQDIDQQEFVWRIHDSTFAKSYGESKHPVCNVVRGLFTGAAIFLMGKKSDHLEGVETKCISMGNEYCEFIIKNKDKFKTNDPLVERQLKEV